MTVKNGSEELAAKGIQEAAEEGLKEELAPSQEQADKSAEGQAKKEEQPKEDEKGTQGKEKIEEDPEFDLGADKEGKPLKLKKSQILEMQKGSMLQADYTKKTQELAEQKAQLKELVEIVEFLKKNPKKAEKVIAILEAKEEELEKQEGKLEAKEDEIDNLLKELPEDDPYAKALRAQKVQIQQALKVNQDLQSKLEQIEKRSTAADESKLYEEAHQTLTEVMDATQKALEFADKEEGDYWRKSVLTYLVNSPKEYERLDKEQFAEYFKDIAKRVYDDIKKIGEKHVKRYIESKGHGKVPAAPGASGKPLSKTPDMNNLQEVLEEQLKEEENKQ